MRDDLKKKNAVPLRAYIRIQSDRYVTKKKNNKKSVFTLSATIYIYIIYNRPV